MKIDWLYDLPNQRYALNCYKSFNRWPVALKVAIWKKSSRSDNTFDLCSKQSQPLLGEATFEKAKNAMQSGGTNGEDGVDIPRRIFSTTIPGIYLRPARPPIGKCSTT